MAIKVFVSALQQLESNPGLLISRQKSIHWPTTGLRFFFLESKDSSLSRCCAYAIRDKSVEFYTLLSIGYLILSRVCFVWNADAIFGKFVAENEVGNEFRHRNNKQVIMNNIFKSFCEKKNLGTKKNWPSSQWKLNMYNPKQKRRQSNCKVITSWMSYSKDRIKK